MMGAALIAAALSGVGGGTNDPANLLSLVADNSNTSQTSYTATFDASADVGTDCVIILGTSGLSGSITVTTDSAGNTWTLITSWTGNSRRQAAYGCTLTNAIVGGATTILLTASTTGRLEITGIKGDYLNWEDATWTSPVISASATTLASPSGTLPGPAVALIDWLWKANAAAVTADTGDGWVKTVEDIVTGAASLTLSTKIVSGTTAQTDDPAWAGAVACAAAMLIIPGR